MLSLEKYLLVVRRTGSFVPEGWKEMVCVYMFGTFSGFILSHMSNHRVCGTRSLKNVRDAV